MLCYAMLCYAVLCCTMLGYAMLCFTILYYAMLCYAMTCCTMLYYAMPYYARSFITAQLHQHQLSTGQLSAQMQQVQEKSHKAERETQRQRGEIEQQARLIQELSTRLMEPTALPAPTDSWQPTANSIASLKATRPGRPSMNASGSSRAASSDETAAKTAGWSTDPDQPALRHQRGGDNPRSGVGSYPAQAFIRSLVVPATALGPFPEA